MACEHCGLTPWRVKMFFGGRHLASCPVQIERDRVNAERRKTMCAGSGRRVTMSVGDESNRQTLCPSCGKYVGVRPVRIEWRIEGTIPQHKPKLAKAR